MHKHILPLVLLLGLAAPLAHAQELGRAESTLSNAGTYYFLYEPGEATIQVSAIGAVRQPGLYEVAAATDLRRLLVLSGGPELAPQNARNDRRVTVQLLRQGSAQPVFSAGLDEAMARGSAPGLREGDVLLVEVLERERFNWRDAFTVVGGLSAIAFIVQTVVSVSN
jgi:protein involved in polysaccharide export with SLBB domain